MYGCVTASTTHKSFCMCECDLHQAQHAACIQTTVRAAAVDNGVYVYMVVYGNYPLDGGKKAPVCWF